MADPKKGLDVFSRMLAQRMILIGTPITDEIANVAIAQLLFLESEAPDQPVMLWLQTPGGQVSATLAIFDTIQKLRCPVHTVAKGNVAGIALLVLAAGAHGQRAALVDARLGFTPITATIPDQAAEIERTRRTVARLLAEATGKPEDVVDADMCAGRALTAEEARAYGLVDIVVTPKPRR
jgi:ATP-dependent Clp protease protease subunit